MAATQSSTQSDSQTQKSEIWQNEHEEAQTHATEVRTDPFLIHYTKLTVIQGIYPTKRRKIDGDPKRSSFQACDLLSPGVCVCVCVCVCGVCVCVWRGVCVCVCGECVCVEGCVWRVCVCGGGCVEGVYMCVVCVCGGCVCVCGGVGLKKGVS